jgi:hypothetical protein
LPSTFAVTDDPIIVHNINGSQRVLLTPAAGDDLLFGETSFGTAVAYTVLPGQIVVVYPHTANTSWTIELRSQPALVKVMKDHGTITGNTTHYIDLFDAGVVTVNGTGIVITLNTSYDLPNNTSLSGTIWVTTTGGSTGTTVVFPSGWNQDIEVGTPPGSAEHNIFRWYYMKYSNIERAYGYWKTGV